MAIPDEFGVRVPRTVFVVVSVRVIGTEPSAVVVTVNVTVWPTMEWFGEEFSVRVVAICGMMSKNLTEIAGGKIPEPGYVEVNACKPGVRVGRLKVAMPEGPTRTVVIAVPSTSIVTGPEGIPAAEASTVVKVRGCCGFG